jgi:hypothetical protein
MAGGQQINSSQGTLTAEGGDLLVLSGQAATGSQGAYTKGNSVRLRSRKVGGGTATHPLTGQALAASMGLFTPVPSVAPTTQVATLLGGSFSATSRERALTGSAVTSAAGTLGTGGNLLSWAGVSGATGYKVYWDSISGPPYTNSVDVGIQTNYDATPFGAGTWYANIRSYDESGLEGPWGTETEVTI